jgi:hypothetical protein
MTAPQAGLPLLAVAAACVVAACNEPGGGGPAHFRVTNQTAGPVYLQVDSPGVHWQLTRNGEALRAVDRCELCECSAPKCAVCGQSFGAVEAMAPGAAFSWTWDGHVRRTSRRSPGVDCEIADLLPPSSLEISVSYGRATRKTDTGTYVDGTIATASAAFEHAGGETVEITLR